MKESFAKKETSTCVYFVAFKLSFNEELDELGRWKARILLREYLPSFFRWGLLIVR